MKDEDDPDFPKRLLLAFIMLLIMLIGQLAQRR